MYSEILTIFNIQQGNLAMVNALIAAGADVNLRDTNGNSAYDFGKEKN